MPVAWDRLADAKQPEAAARALSIIALGHVHEPEITALTPHFDRLEQLVLDVPPRDPLAKHRAEFNRAVDTATSDWALVVRERERIDPQLAGEIAQAVAAPKARGYRVRSVPFYAGKPLRFGAQNEVRLFHRRYYMRFANKGEWDEISVQGSVVRLNGAFQSITFDSAAEHRAYLERTAVPHSRLRRTLLFLRDLVVTRTVDRNTLRYIWTEAGFDRE